MYKAEDLQYDYYQNDWDIDGKDNCKWTTPPLRKDNQHSDERSKSQKTRKPRYVAIKKIYVTSSPQRILNELELLDALSGCKSVCPLITAFRHSDQVVAILPYYRHTDFRDYFRDMTIEDMRIYFRSLFTALEAVHAEGILHRDIKPTNFLYEPSRKRGVLVDFGLAERENHDSKPCLCLQSRDDRRRRLENSLAIKMGPSTGFPKNDTRSARRANRAGTRGFRAPEVLFKCTAQTTKIDVWSAGVILLTILTKRFPFFNSTDDVEALIEIATIFGIKQMKQCAMLHGTVMETNIETIGNSGHKLEKIVLWSTCRAGDEKPLDAEEKQAVSFLERCLELDAHKRIGASEALQHDFLRDPDMACTEDDDEMDIL